MIQQLKVKRFVKLFSIILILLLFVFVSAPNVYAEDGILGVAAGIAGDGVNMILKPVLIALTEVVKLLPGLGLAFIKWVLRPDITTAVLDGGQIYAFWAFIRDLFNVFFLMTLLFSAFATIFQIEKFNYKKIFAKLIIAALLVNFSFPIARILIDFSNILLYSLLGLMSSLLGFGNPDTDAIRMLDAGGYVNLVAVNKDNVTLSVLFSLIVSLFLIGMSFLAMGFLLLIRLFVLVILVIFSPIAFIAPAIPGVSKYSSMWWDNLLKYSFFAPIMMLFFYIALSFVIVLKTQQAKLSAAAGNQITTLSSSVLSSMIFALIPVLIIWIGMGVAMKMGIAGAEATMGRAKKAGKWMSGLPGVGFRATGVPGAWQKNVEYLKKKGVSVPFTRKRIGGSEKREAAEARMAGGVFRVPGAKTELESKKVKDIKEKREMENMTSGNLHQIIADKSKDKYEVAAATQELAARGVASEEHLTKIRASFSEDSPIFKQLQAKVKLYDPVAAFSHIKDTDKKKEAIKDFINSNQFDFKKINANSLGNLDFMQQAFEAGAISTKDIAEASSKNPGKATSIKKSLIALASDPNNGATTDPAKKAVHSAIHMAHFAQTGEIINDDFAPEIFKNMTKETAANITERTVRNYSKLMARHINAGRYKEIIQHVNSKEAQKEFNFFMGSANFETDPSDPEGRNPNGESIQRIIRRDQYLRNLY